MQYLTRHPKANNDQPTEKDRADKKRLVTARGGEIQRRTSRCEVAGQLGLPQLIERLQTTSSVGASSKEERHGIRSLLRQIEACYAGAAGYAKLEALIVVMTVGLVGLGLLGHDVASWAGALVHQVVGSISGHGATASAGLVAPRLGRGARTARHALHGHRVAAGHVAHHAASAHPPLTAHVPAMMANLHALIALVAPHWHLVAIGTVLVGFVFCVPAFGHDPDRGVRHGPADVPIERDQFLMYLAVGGMVIFFVGLATGVIGPIGGFGPGLVSHLIGSVTGSAPGAQGVS